MANKESTQEFSRRKNRHLIFSLLLDAIGMASYSIPLLAEVGDLVYAPIYAFAIFMMYNRKTIPALLGGAVGAVEELLPTTDIIPTATLMWIYTYVLSSNNDPKKISNGENP